MMTKMFMKMSESLRAPGGPSPWAHDDFAASMMDEYALTLHDEVRLAIVKAEIRGPDDALDQLETMSHRVDPFGELAGDIAALQEIYEVGPESVSPDDREGLIERHGWYGHVALTFGSPKTDPDRRDLLGGGGVFMLAITPIMLAILVGLMASLPLAITAIIMVGLGNFRLRLQMPAPGGSVYFETFALFLLAFLALILISPIIEAEGGRIAEISALLGPWVIAPVVLWPLVRGVPWKTLRRDLGWSRGEGVFKEIGCGFVGYLASLPAYIIVVLMMVVAEIVRLEIMGGPDENPPPDELMLDLSGPDRWFKLAALMAMLTLWAPIVEETIFRGALFRHMTGRIHWIFAALISSIIFGAIHPYPIIGIVPVALLGLVFALMRRWRGSLIAPMTAHALHNGTIGTILVLILVLVAE
jgi:membrane protease YdiL (CAAX protease family)